MTGVQTCALPISTLSMDGLVLVNDHELVMQVQSVAREVFDVTGAGDTFIAYLGIGLAGGDDIQGAVRMANFAAGIQVSKIGTSIVYPNEILAAMGKRTKNHWRTVDGSRIKDVLARLKMAQADGKKIVFTNGCFDLLHAGHVGYLKKAASLGDILVVGINDDDSVRRLKGGDRPLNKLEDRRIVLESLECVDHVIPFGEDTPLKLIERVEPDVLVKGGDYQADKIVGAALVQARGGTVTTIPFIEGRSTTELIRKMTNSTI